MKKKDLSQLSKKSISELSKMVENWSTEVMETKAKVKTGKEKNLKKAKNIKVDIAQTKTIIRQKQIEESEKALMEKENDKNKK